MLPGSAFYGSKLPTTEEIQDVAVEMLPIISRLSFSNKWNLLSFDP